jgi:hypothetical protein
MTSLLPTILTSLFTAFVAAVLTAWFSLWRFRSERWWEKKFSSYLAIMEALHDMQLGFDEYMEKIYRGMMVIGGMETSLEEKFIAGKREIYKQIDIGEFLLSPATVKALQDVLGAVEHAKDTPSYSEYADSASFAIATCLKQMRMLARNDLQRGARAWLMLRSRRM